MKTHHRRSCSAVRCQKRLQAEHLEPRQMLATTSVASGSWHDPAVWDNGVPTIGEDVVVAAGTTIALDGADHTARTLLIRGMLEVVENDVQAKRLAADWILVEGGVFQVGTAADRYDENSLVVTLEGDAPDQSLPSLGIGSNDAFLMTRQGGQLSLFGAEETSWTQLGATAQPGALSIELKEPVTWDVGDEIVVASTTFDMNEAETRIVTSVLDGGRRLRLNAPLDFQHFGELQFFDDGQGRVYDLDERAEVGLLSHNIRIEGDADATVDGVGGHLMFMPGSGQIQIDGVELYHMGQRGRLARYPIHWHLTGERAGDFVKNTSIHRSFNRAVTIHATHNVLIERTVAYDHIGHGYFLENAVETGNTFYYNLGLVTREPNPDEALLPTDLGPKQFQISGPGTYWITNPDNQLIGNVAGGSEDGSGFWYALPTGPLNESRYDPQYAGVAPQRTSLGVFADNRAHSNGIGLDLDGGPNVETDVAESSHYAPDQLADFARFTGFANTRNGVYYRGNGHIELTDSRLADNHIDVMFAFNQKVRDTLLAGVTDNDFGGVTKHAFAVYDGPTHAENVHFAGFNVPGADLFEVIGAANRNTNHTFQNVTFDAVTPVTFDDTGPNNSLSRHWGFALRDLDGTLTGAAGHSIVFDHPMMRTDDDVIPPGWKKARLSPHAFGHLRLIHQLGPGANPTVSFRREGGPGGIAGHTDSATLDPFNQIGVVLNTDFVYEATYVSSPTTGLIDLSLTDVVGGGYVYLKINNPWDWFSVENADEKASEQEVRDSSGAAYVLDAEGNAFVKLVVPATASQTLVRLREAAAPAPLMTLTPSDDAFLDGATGQNNSLLKLREPAAGDQTIYLKFNVAGVAGRVVQDATLRLTVAGNEGAGTIRLYQGASNSWTEANLSPATAPATSGVLATASGAYLDGSTVQFDLSDHEFVDGQLTLILKISGGSDDVWFSATEGDYPPQLVLDFRPQPATGDFDGDGLASGNDLLAWQRGYGAASGAAQSDGDGDHDGDVDADDLTVWQQQFGVGLSGGSSVASAALAATPTTGSRPLLALAGLRDARLADGSGSGDAVVERRERRIGPAPISDDVLPTDTNNSTPAAWNKQRLAGDGKQTDQVARRPVDSSVVDQAFAEMEDQNWRRRVARSD